MTAQTSFIFIDQLSRYLSKGFKLCYSESSRSWPIHPQDLELIDAVAEITKKGSTAIVVAPYVTSLSLAFLIRAMAVGTVGRPPLIIYSPDESIREYYSKLSYLSDPRVPISTIYPMRGRRVMLRKSSLELSLARGEATLIYDARSSRISNVTREQPWQFLRGPKIFLTVLDDHPILHLIKDAELIYLRNPGKFVTEWPPVFGSYVTRLNNYSNGVSLTPETVPGEMRALTSLEFSLQKLIRESKGTEQLRVPLIEAERLNHFLQDAVFPLSIYEQAAHELGKAWVKPLISYIKAATRLDIPALARNSLYYFLHCANVALSELELKHPPKVSWFKQEMLQNIADETILYCRSEVERLAAEKWIETETVKRLRLKLVNLQDLRSFGVSSRIIIAGPPTKDETAYILGGASSQVRVLVYEWQARHWNLIMSRSSKLLRQIRPLVEQRYSLSSDREDIGIDWSTSESSKRTLTDEEILKKEFGAKSSSKSIKVKTDHGEVYFDEDATVPTLEIDKFADRPVTMLQQGDVIIIRTEGNISGVKRAVDAIATSSPLMIEAAHQASLWRTILSAYTQSRNLRYKDMHKELFPNNEVTYATVRSWFLNDALISPHYKNFLLLLSKIGIPSSESNGMLESVRRYRSYRAKAYNHLYRSWRRYSAKVYMLEDEEEDETKDEKIDPEFGLTLESLEDFITFARVTGSPGRGNQSQ